MVAFTALELECLDLCSTDLVHNLRCNACPGDQRVTDLHPVIAGIKQDVLKCGGCPDLKVKLLDINPVAFSNFVLLATSFKNRVRHFRLRSKVMMRELAAA